MWKVCSVWGAPLPEGFLRERADPASFGLKGMRKDSVRVTGE